VPNFLIYLEDEHGVPANMIVQAATGTDAAGYGEELEQILEDYTYNGWYELTGEPKDND